MIKIQPDKLKNLLDKHIYSNYILFGSEPFQIHESLNLIKLAIKRRGSAKYFNVIVDIKTDWKFILSKYESISLFDKYQIIDIDLSIIKSFNNIEKQIIQLINLINKDIILVFRLSNINQLQNYISKFKNFIQKSILIPCFNLNKNQILSWIKNRIKLMNLEIDNDSINLLCHCYENNLLELNQQLEIFSLIWPKTKLNLKLLKKVIFNSQNFNILNWIDSLLEGNIKIALNILNNLSKKNIDIIFLLRILQNDVLILLNILNGNNENIKKQKNFFRYNQNKLIFVKASKRLDIKKIRKILNLIFNIECLLKKNYIDLTWDCLKTLSILFCCNFTSGIIDEI